MSIPLKGLRRWISLPSGSLNITLPLALLIAMPVVVKGQAAASASITGHVTDQTGAPVPVTLVAVTSPALQVASVTTVTDQEGNYQVLDLLAPGVFKINFSHSGFQTFVRADLNVSVGFAARVDVMMKIGAVEQTVEVTGSSPVLDTVNTTGGTTLQLAEIQETPKGLGLQ